MVAPGRHRRFTATACALGIGALSLIGVPARAETEITSTLRAVGVVGTTVTGADQVTVGGDTGVRVDVADREGGRIKIVSGPDSSLPDAWSFPSYAPLGLYPRAVLGVTPTSGESLSPGGSDFSYGAVFRLDENSSGRFLDDGDNLFQLGRYADPAMFKLQVDDGHPSCLVKGTGGRVLVRSSTEVTPDRWYRAACSREGSEVSIMVRSYGDADTTVMNQNEGATGTLSLPLTRPASIGGKLTVVGYDIASASDQFNGAVAKVWINRD